MEDDKKPVPTSDDIRDALATHLHDRITKPGEEEVPAAVLAVAVAYLKQNPPASLPPPGSPTGLLKKHLESRKDLPFGGPKGAH